MDLSSLYRKHFLITGINAIATTKIAEVYHSGSRKKLALLSSKTAALAIFCGLPLISMFTIWPQFFLGLFGSEFVTGSFALRVLVIGQAANLLSGSVVQILSMTEYHKEVGYITFVTAVILNLILTALLVPSYGINGAALAVGISLTLQNVILLLMVKRYLNIWSLPGRAMSHWLRPSKT